MPPGPVSRRAFLAAGAGAVIVAGSAGLSACSGADEAVKPASISPLVLSSDLYASSTPQRFVFAIARDERYASRGAAKVAFAAPGADRGPVLSTTLYKAGLPKGRGIYVVETAFPSEGVWQGIVLHERRRTPFAMTVKPAADAPLAGTAAPRAASPTLSDPLGVEPICTREPACPLHDVSLADAIGSGKPVAVLFATPALCQSQYCGPVLEELLDVMDGYRDAVTMVHVEIYASNRSATLAPTVAAWGLPSEPWFYTVNGDGVIQERLDGAMARKEMERALERLAGSGARR